MIYGRVQQKRAQLQQEVAAILRPAAEVNAAEERQYGAARRGDEWPAELAFREDRLRKIVETIAAEEKGISIGIENHASALNSSEDSILWLAEFSLSPALGPAIDHYHLPDDSELIALLIRGPDDKLAHFYAWQRGMGCMEKLPKEQDLLQLLGPGKMKFVPNLRSLMLALYFF